MAVQFNAILGEGLTGRRRESRPRVSAGGSAVTSDQYAPALAPNAYKNLSAAPLRPELWQQLHDLLASLPPIETQASTSSAMAPTAAPTQPAPHAAALAQAPPPTAAYTVVSGDSLWAIAARELGDGNRWHELYAANIQVIGPDAGLIHPGQVLTSPGKTGAASALPPVPAPALAPAPRASYTVKSGDSLSAIAQETFGDMNRWQEPYDLNRDVIGPNPNVIQVGQVLRLPGGAAVPAPQPPSGNNGDTPYINQYTPAGREGGYTNGNSNCGPTGVAMIARAFGYRNDLTDAKLINHLGGIGGTGGDGTSVNGIAAMGRAMGLNAKMRGPGAQVDWIASELRAGRKVMANGDYFAMAPHTDSGRTSGHYVLVHGIDGNGNFLVHDPADRRVATVSADELSTFIRSNPNGGYQISIGR